MKAINQLNKLPGGEKLRFPVEKMYRLDQDGMKPFMNPDKERSISTFISLILRHKPEVIGIKLDEHGWADVKNLLDGINFTGRELSFSELDYIVRHDKKNRYSFNEDQTKIRANQGHSINVDVELKKIQPPRILYHGTSDRFLDSIMRDGLKSMKRLYVHLSKDILTAETVGRRHEGNTIIFEVNSCDMYFKSGYEFYLSENGVYLTKEVPAKFLKLLPPR